MDDDKLLKLATIVGKLKKQVGEITSQTEQITKLEGPQGPKGEQGLAGKAGKDGKDGVDGRNGRDGKDGKDGVDGEDGISVVDARIDLDGSLVLSLSDGSVIDAGEVVSPVVSSPDNYTVLTQQYNGPQIYVQTSTPSSASQGDLWFHTS